MKHSDINTKFYLSDSTSCFKENGIWRMYNWLNGANCAVNEPEHLLYKTFEEGKRSFIAGNDINESDLEYLTSMDFITKTPGIITGQIRSRYEKNISAERLSLTLLPAGQACNFACGYCYEDHSDRSRMDDSHKDALYKFIIQYKSRYLHIGYFGGEPLCNKDFILSFNSGLKQMQEEYGFTLTSSITTNAYLLTEEVFRQLLEAEVRSFQITIDGLQEDHDRLRPLCGGKGTYEKIMANLKAITRLERSRNFTIDLRVNFNMTSAEESKRTAFLRMIKEEFGHDKRFRIRFRPISDYSSLNDKKNDGHSYCSKLESQGLKKQYEAEAQACDLYLADMKMYEGTGAYSCYAGKPNSIVVTPDLTVHKCTVALDNSLNNTGQITSEGEFIKNENWEKWVRNNAFEDKKCTGCQFLNQCLGNACPLINIEKGSRICPDLINDISHPIKLIITHLEKIEG